MFETRQLTSARIALVALASSLMLLAGAHAFEIWGGLAPCPLCLNQREAHWAAAAIALATWLTTRQPDWTGPQVFMFGGLVAAYAVSAGIAGFHAGVEWGWFEVPATCGAGGGGESLTARDLLERLGQSASAPSGGEVPWSLFGISMAGYNLLASVALAAFSAIPVARYLSAGGRTESAVS